jgi:hypothetical protein
MNVAIPGYKVGRKPSLFLAAVAATALGIATAAGIWQVAGSGSGGGSSAAGTVHRNYEFAGTDTRTLWLYIVDSPDQEAMVLAGEQEAAMERASANIPEPNVTVLIMKANTVDEEINVSEVLEAWSSAPGGVRIVDMRQEPLGPISIVPAEPELEGAPSAQATGEPFGPCSGLEENDPKRLELAVFGAC